MSVTDSLTQTVERGVRRATDGIPVSEGRLATFLKRAIPIGWFGLLVLAVLVTMLLISFQPTTDSDVFVAEYTLENYARLFTSSLYLEVFLTTVKLSGLAALLAVVLSYPAAYYVGVKLPKRYQYPLTLAIIVPTWTLFIIRVFAWMTILGTNGTLHKILLALGLVDQSFSLLNTELAVVVVLAQIWYPMAFLPIYSAMSGIDDEYFDAVRDLGGTRWDAFRHLVFPLTLPSAFGGFLLVFLPAMGAYVIPLLIGGQQGFVIARVIASQFLSAYDWPFGAALATVLGLVVLTMIWLLQQIISLREALRGFA